MSAAQIKKPDQIIASACENIGMTYSGGRLKMTTRDGTVFSSGNISYVVMPSITAGSIVRLLLDTDTHYFDDDSAASSHIVGEEFGTTAGVAWGNARPFFVYICNYDDTDDDVRFFISPNPCLKLSPNSIVNIGYQGVPAPTPSDNNAFFLTSTNVRTGAKVYTNKPCMCIGSFTMTKSASDDWTVLPFTANDGIGLFQKGVEFTFPTGQMGAATSTYLYNNGGTAPLFNTNNYKYTIDVDGYCTAPIELNGDGGTDGSGAVTTRLALPYVTQEYSEAWVAPCVRVLYSAGGSNAIISGKVVATSTSYIQLYTSASTAMNNSQWSNGNRGIWGTVRFKAFNSLV